ncbi:MAG: phosphate propanoyltransferase [Clostridia bacterium]
MENLKVLVETSARHIHVSRADLDALFGEGYELTNKKDLSQPGQFACEERVTVAGPKGTFNVSILGPIRPATQLEISLVDARAMGISAPIRESGDTKGSADVTITGPKGEVLAKESTIVAKRHIHITPDDAKAHNLADKEIVMVKVASPDRSLIFDDVVIRVREDFATAMHIDVDEANAGGLAGVVYGEVIKK